MAKKEIDGVVFLHYENTYIDPGIQIGVGSIIEPNVTIRGKTKIGKNVQIQNGATIIDSTIGDNSYIGHCALIRSNSILANNTIVGKSVELKNVIMGEHSGVYHLSFIGDSRIGKNVMIGAGTVVANKDFDNKTHIAVIEDNVKIGVNSIIISPLKISKNVMIGAGSIITKDIEPDQLVFTKRELVYRKKR